MSTEIGAVFTATLEYRPAKSACCSALLVQGAAAGAYDCAQCQQPTERVLGEPQQITATSSVIE